MTSSEKNEFQDFSKKFPEREITWDWYILQENDKDFEKLSSEEKLRQVKNFWIRGDVNKDK